MSLSAAFLIPRQLFKSHSRKVQAMDNVFVFLNHKSIRIFPLWREPALRCCNRPQQPQARKSREEPSLPNVPTQCPPRQFWLPNAPELAGLQETLLMVKCQFSSVPVQSSCPICRRQYVDNSLQPEGLCQLPGLFKGRCA